MSKQKQNVAETTEAKAVKKAKQAHVTYPGDRPLTSVPEDFSASKHKRLTPKDFATKSLYFRHAANIHEARRINCLARAEKLEARKDGARARLEKRLAKARAAAEKAAAELKRMESVE
jgi:hypothetical protein